MGARVHRLRSHNRTRAWSKRDHVAVRSKSDGGGQAGGGGVLQAGRSPRRGVLQRHHGEERSVRGEGSRRGGQAGQAARVLQPRQAPGHGRGRAGGDEHRQAEVGGTHGPAHDRGMTLNPGPRGRDRPLFLEPRPWPSSRSIHDS